MNSESEQRFDDLGDVEQLGGCFDDLGDERDPWQCAFPGQCVNPHIEHHRSECATVEMMEAWESYSRREGPRCELAGCERLARPGPFIRSLAGLCAHHVDTVSKHGLGLEGSMKDRPVELEIVRAELTAVDQLEALSDALLMVGATILQQQYENKMLPAANRLPPGAAPNDPGEQPQVIGLCGPVKRVSVHHKLLAVDREDLAQTEKEIDALCKEGWMIRQISDGLILMVFEVWPCGRGGYPVAH